MLAYDLMYWYLRFEGLIALKQDLFNMGFIAVQGLAGGGGCLCVATVFRRPNIRIRAAKRIVEACPSVSNKCITQYDV